MCLVVLALRMHPRWPLVIAANRDEFHDRATAPMDWWPDAPSRILAGKDLAAGGTWMGLSEQGRLALLTNVRDPSRHRADAPSRGALVADWLGNHRSVHEATNDYLGRGCNPFNLLLADAGGSRWWWMGDGVEQVLPLGPGLYGLSNARLDTPWPKVQRLKAAVSQALTQAPQARALADHLLAALADRAQPADETLPRTGVALDVERFLAPAFISGAGLPRPYGTRSSTVLWVEAADGAHALHVRERGFDAKGEATQTRHWDVSNWPWKAGEPAGISGHSRGQPSA
jgi:uncharacterized protein with NRDE domain